MPRDPEEECGEMIRFLLLNRTSLNQLGPKSSSAVTRHRLCGVRTQKVRLFWALALTDCLWRSSEAHLGPGLPNPGSLLGTILHCCCNKTLIGMKNDHEKKYIPNREPESLYPV